MRRFMHRAFALALLFALLPAAAARPVAAEELSRVAAIINSETITTLQLERELALFQVEGSLPEARDAEHARELRAQALEQLISEELERQRARQLGISVTDRELEQAITDVLRQNRMSREQLEQAIVEGGMSFADYRERLRRQMLRFKLLGQELGAAGEVGEEDVRAYFRENIETFRGGDRVRLSYVALRAADAAGREALWTLAGELLARLRQGESVEAVLAAYASDPRVSGGSLGAVAEDELDPVFANAVIGLRAGESSPPVERDQSLVLLKVEERAPGSLRQYDEVREEIRARLQRSRQEQAHQAWREKLRASAHIEVLL